VSVEGRKRWFKMRRASVSMFVWMAVTACSGAGGTEPPYPPLAGIYSATFAVTATSTAGTDVLDVATGTITLMNAASDHTFGGSFVQGTSTGRVFGAEEMDGGLIISEFGNPDDTPFVDLASLRQQLPECAFGNSVANDPTGTLAINQLAITGAVTLPCVWDVGGTQETLVTTLAVTISGSR
jgi:hypothetical protein